MSRKKISTTIYVTPEQSEKLKLLHERTKVPVAVYIREGIDLVLRQYGNLLPGQLPLDAQPAREPRAQAYARTGGNSPAATTSSANGESEADDADHEPSPSAGGGSFGAHSAHAAAKK